MNNIYNLTYLEFAPGGEPYRSPWRVLLAYTSHWSFVDGRTGTQIDSRNNSVMNWPMGAALPWARLKFDFGEDPPTVTLGVLEGQSAHKVLANSTEAYSFFAGHNANEDWKELYATFGGKTQGLSAAEDFTWSGKPMVDIRLPVPWGSLASPSMKRTTGGAECRWQVYFNQTYVPPDDEDDEDASVSGDPHVINMNGKRFDIFSSGLWELVRLPRATHPSDADLTIDAIMSLVAAKPCSPTVIKEFVIGGKSLGGRNFRITAHEQGPRVTLDGNTLAATCKSEDCSWAAVGPSFSWKTGATGTISVSHGKLVAAFSQQTSVSGYQFLNLHVTGLSSYGDDAGGLLGVDEYTGKALPPPECRGVHLTRGSSLESASHMAAN